MFSRGVSFPPGFSISGGKRKTFWDFWEMVDNAGNILMKVRKFLLAKG
jgi:hypothetical protein